MIVKLDILFRFLKDLTRMRGLVGYRISLIKNFHYPLNDYLLRLIYTMFTMFYP